MKKIPFLAASFLACQFAFAEEDEKRNHAQMRSWKVTVGAGAATVPRYEGAGTNRIRFVPLLDLQHGRFFAGTARGIGYNLSDNPALQYGPRLSVAPYRRQSVDARLNGMGDIGYGAEAGAYFNARLAPWYFKSSIAAGNHGTRLNFGGGYVMKLAATDKLNLGIGVNWANARYMQTYFGVTAAQAAASGGVLTAYNAGAGIKNYELKANWTHVWSRQWFSTAGVSIRQLAGTARNSPLTMRRTASSASFVVGYRF